MLKKTLVAISAVAVSGSIAMAQGYDDLIGCGNKPKESNNEEESCFRFRWTPRPLQTFYASACFLSDTVTVDEETQNISGTIAGSARVFGGYDIRYIPPVIYTEVEGFVTLNRCGGYVEEEQ